MRITPNDSPARLARFPRDTWIVLRVLTGSILLSPEAQILTSGGGLPVAVADNIVRIVWPAGDLWVQGSIGAIAEVILP